MRRNVIDRMALLCTLHADGPRTIRILREAGCTTIDKIVKLPPEKVGKVLNLAPAAARRFTHEAKCLLQRLEPDLELEEVTYPPASQPLAVKPPPPSILLEEFEKPEEAPPVGSMTSGAVSAPRSTTRTHLDVRDQELLNKVVQRWREKEPTITPVRIPASDSAQKDLRVVEILAGGVRDLEVETPLEKHVPIETPPQMQPAERLKPGDLPGLDATGCEVLGLAGIISLEDLATIPIDELVQRSRLTFTRARTLQYLAGRHLVDRAQKRSSDRRGASLSADRSSGTADRFSPSQGPSYFEISQGAGDLGGPANYRIRREKGLLHGLESKAPGLEGLDDGGVAGPFA